jgi:hypothetical protein
MTAHGNATTGTARPSIPKLVKVAKIPAAGVKPPYIQDWKAAAIEPEIPNMVRHKLDDKCVKR